MPIVVSNELALIADMSANETKTNYLTLVTYLTCTVEVSSYQLLDISRRTAGLLFSKILKCKLWLK